MCWEKLRDTVFQRGKMVPVTLLWHLAFCEKQNVAVAVTRRIRWLLEDRSYCPTQMLLWGCCRSQVLVLRWLYCLPLRVYLAMPFVSMPTTANPFFPIGAQSFVVCDQ